MKLAPLSLAAALAVLPLVGTGCSHDKDDMSSNKSMTMMNKSLYDRLGGEKAIAAVVDDFVGRAAADPKVNFTRKGTDKEWAATPENVAKLKKHLTQFVAMAAGGPQKYEGRAMKPVHMGMKITDSEFNAIAADLAASLDKFNVPMKEKNELLSVVASTKGDIVGQ